MMFKELFKYSIRFLMTNLIIENFHLCNFEIFLQIIHKYAIKNNKNFFYKLTVIGRPGSLVKDIGFVVRQTIF